MWQLVGSCLSSLLIIADWLMRLPALAVFLIQLPVQPVDAGLELLHGCRVAVGQVAGRLLHLLPSLCGLCSWDGIWAVSVLAQHSLLCCYDWVSAAGGRGAAGLSPEGHVPSSPGGDSCSQHALLQAP